MIRSIVAMSLRFRGLVLGVAASSILLGYTQLPNASLGVAPEFGPPYVEIQTEALGLSADEVEQLITVPLEADLLQGVAFLDEIHSESVAGLSSIVMIFDPGTDIYRARQVVAERLTQAHALPNVSKAPAMLPPLSSTSRVLMVSLASDEMPAIDLSVLAKWTIRTRLMGVPGVANVAIWGMRERQLQVLVDPALLRAHAVTLQDVIETTGNSLWVSPLTYLEASTPGTGGFIDTPNQRLGVHHLFPIRSADDLAQVPISPEQTGGRVVRLGDVADVRVDHQLLIGDAVVNDGPGLMLVIEKFPDAGTLEVTRGVDDALAALSPGLDGVTVDAHVFRPATFIEEAIANVGLALVMGLVLGALALLAFFRGWRSALTGFVSVLVSLTMALLVLHVAGASFDPVVVGGLALGTLVVIDDAIVGIDAIERRRESADAQGGRRSASTAIAAAVASVRSPATYATLIGLAAAAPLFLVGGVAGAFLPALVIAFAVAILASLLVAVTVTPALCSLLGIGASRTRPYDASVRRLQGPYGRALSGVLRRTRVSFAAAAGINVVVIVILGIGAIPTLGTSIVPSFKERDLQIHLDAAPGTSRLEMNRILARAGAELRAVPGVLNVGGHVGRAITSDLVASTNASSLWVSIDPAADYQTALVAIGDVIDGYPGLSRAVRTYTSERIDRVLGERTDDVVVRVYGQDEAVIRRKADEVREALAAIPGLVAATAEQPILEPALEITVDLAAAERYGLKPGDVRRATTTLLAGLEVGFIFEEQKVFEVVVWGTAELRHSVSSVSELPIGLPGGGEVRLGDIAEVRIAASPSVIRREGVFRYVDVGATVSGRDLDAVLRDIDDQLGAIEFPLEYRIEVFSPEADRHATLRGVSIAAVAALILALLLLQAAFGSWWRAVLLLASLPFALVGAALGAIVTGGEISIGVIAGFLGVFALAIRHAMLLVDRCQRLERDPEAAFGPALVVRGAKECLAPMLASTIAAGLVVVPFVVLGDRPGYEILRPMAIVVLGGLVSSALFSLFLVPAVYLLFGPSPEADQSTELAERPGLSPA